MEVQTCAPVGEHKESGAVSNHEGGGIVFFSVDLSSMLELQSLRTPGSKASDYVFQSRNHTHRLSTTHVWRIVGVVARGVGH
jgi:hypothetical protein